MFVAALLIGLREGLEAALVLGILVGFVVRRDRAELIRPIAWGTGIAVVLSVAIGALFTFGRYRLSFQAQEVIGGVMSLLAVAMVTWMIFWMAKAGRGMKATVEAGAEKALALGGASMFWLAFLTVGREGVETTLMLWGWAMQPIALLGAALGIGIAVALGYLAFRSVVRINYARFFRWTGAFLVVMAAGILTYGIGDLQEARVLPGPFSGAPITPTDFRTGEVLVGFFTDRPYWGAAFPFGWAFDVQDVVDPAGVLAAILQGVVGFQPLMSWLQVLGWALYLGITLPVFLRRTRVPRVAAPAPASEPVASAPEQERELVHV